MLSCYVISTSPLATQEGTQEHSLIGKTGNFKFLIFSSSLNALVFNATPLFIKL
jgi:hypothetical protein